jgi:anti-sigma factor RsiW
MDYDAQLKLQAFLDGELPEGEARKVTKLVAQDRESAALLEELRNTRSALAGFEAEIRLPESREFFWSKVACGIERLETPAPEPAPLPFFALWRRFLIPAAALALALVVGLVLTRTTGPVDRTAGSDSETAVADASAFTYRDYSAGTTLVWVSYPADNDDLQDDEVGAIN